MTTIKSAAYLRQMANDIEAERRLEESRLVSQTRVHSREFLDLHIETLYENLNAIFESRVRENIFFCCINVATGMAAGKKFIPDDIVLVSKEDQIWLTTILGAYLKTLGFTVTKDGEETVPGLLAIWLNVSW